MAAVRFLGEADGWEPAVSHRGPSVLLIEGAASVLGVLREALARAGFAVDTASTATAALARLDEHRYAAILADCFLPDLPPLDWLAALRGAAPATPLIVYSGSIRLDELRTHAQGFGAVAVLEKPFTPARLVEVVRGALGEAQ